MQVHNKRFSMRHGSSRHLLGNIKRLQVSLSAAKAHLLQSGCGALFSAGANSSFRLRLCSTSDS